MKSRPELAKGVSINERLWRPFRLGGGGLREFESSVKEVWGEAGKGCAWLKSCDSGMH